MIEDWDQLSANDFMGRAVVRLSSLADRARARGWYRLRGDKGGIGRDRDEGCGALGRRLLARVRRWRLLRFAFAWRRRREGEIDPSILM